MTSVSKTLVLVLAILVLSAAPLVAAEELTGSVDGAYYRIVVPDDWNGDLVIWNHGFSLDPVGPDPSLGPLGELQLQQGYAVAASSFRQNGWAVFKTKNDLQSMLGVFKGRFGRPHSVIVTGASLGGIVTAAALEEANLGNVVGAYTLCGALAGSRNWDGALDLRLTYDAVCAGVPGSSIPGGAAGLPADSTITDEQVALAVHACTGILAPPASRTPDQADRLAWLMAVTGLPEEFILGDMFFATFGMGDLVHEKLNGKIGTGNAAVDYGDALINATIERVKPHPGGANRLAKHYAPNGDVGDVKIVSIHTDKDGLVIVENESSYASVVPPENLATAIVVEAEPTHCGFTPAEIVAGWEALRGWIAGAPQPGPAAIQGTCLAIEGAGLADGPCRIDPAFVVPPIDGRIRPR